MGRLTMGKAGKVLGAVVPALVFTIGACSDDGGPVFKNPDGGVDASVQTGGSAGDGSGGGPSSGGRVGDGGGRSGGRSGSGGSGGKAASGGSGGKAGSAGSGGSAGAEAGGSGGSAGSETGGTGGSAGAPDSGPPPDDGSPCHACPSKTCLPDGGCAECVLDKHCPAELPRCDVARNKCVLCLATPTDNCKNGEYCSAANACIPGCKASGGGCASGVCNSEHECTSCIADSECLSGRVCSSGTCAPSCGHDGDCADNQTCCRDRCADLSRDKDHCLACNVACDKQQFCGRSGCADATVANACKSAAVTFLMDGLSIDDQMDGQLRDGMLAGCPDKPTVTMVKQAEATTINPVTGQPVVGSGDLQVIVGGPLGQRLIDYLERTGATRIYYSYDGVIAQFHLRGEDGGAGSVVVNAPLTILNAGHDFFLVEMVADPTTSTLMFAEYGFDIYGTIAGTWYFNNVMLPSLSTYNQGYYIYEWTNADSDPGPSSGDTFTLVTSGF